jgi:hypothetical protein
MKRCTKCGVEKPKDSFNKQSRQKDGLSSWCKDCCREYRQQNKSRSKEYQRQYYREHTEYKREVRKIKRDEIHKLKQPCVKCGETRPYVIDFHHIDPSKKEFEPSQIITASNVRLVNELKKCVCLCRNCHAEFHWLYGNKPKQPVESLEEYLGEDPYKLVGGTL